MTKKQYFLRCEASNIALPLNPTENFTNSNVLKEVILVINNNIHKSFTYFGIFSILRILLFYLGYSTNVRSFGHRKSDFKFPPLVSYYGQFHKVNFLVPSKLLYVVVLTSVLLLGIIMIYNYRMLRNVLVLAPQPDTQWFVQH